MTNKTGILWTDRTWNPVTGCTKISPGCAHCYAEAITLRFKRGPEYLPGKTEIKLHYDRLEESKSPLSIRQPQRIFVCSMSDLFHEEVSDEFIMAVFALMGEAKHHTYQLLTKRPERMLEWFKWASVYLELYAVEHGVKVPEWPLSNVWIGTSVENQYWADRRIPVLLQVPAAIHFISAEPLLKQVDIEPWVTGDTKLDWVIAGGESGPGRRPMEMGWLWRLDYECFANDVPFFMKQDCGPRPGMQGRIPDDLWSRKEFPNAV